MWHLRYTFAPSYLKGVAAVVIGTDTTLEEECRGKKIKYTEGLDGMSRTHDK